MRRVALWIVGIAAAVGAIGICASFNADMGRVREIQEQRRATPTPTPSWSERCLDPWDGSHGGLVELMKQDLLSPDSFQHVETRFTREPVADGTHYVVMQYSWLNAFGVRLQGTGSGYVDPQSCRLVRDGRPG